MAFYSSDDEQEYMRRGTGARGSNDPNPPVATSRDRPRGDAQREGPRVTLRPRARGGTDAFVLPTFVEWPHNFPSWKPNDCSYQEFEMLKCLTNNLPPGRDGEFRDIILELQPQLREDAVNPFLWVSKELTHILRHSDRKREETGRPRLGGGDGYFSWDVLTRDRQAMSRGLKDLDPMVLVACIVFNNKGRFECQVRPRRDENSRPDPALFIRAVQGHTYELDRDLLFSVRIDPAQAVELDPVVHSTRPAFYENDIRTVGLRPGGYARSGGRQAVHFLAFGMHNLHPNRTLSSLRNRDFFIVLNLQSWVSSGREAFLSANGVVNIFETVTPDFFLMAAPFLRHMTPTTPAEWLQWRVTSGYYPDQFPVREDESDSAQADEFNTHYERAWDQQRDPRMDTQRGFRAPAEQPEPADGSRDVEDSLRPRLKDRSLETGEYDHFGDQIPSFLVWQLLDEDQREELAADGITTEDQWYHCYASGFSAYAFYVLIRQAKTLLAMDPAQAVEYKPERWESAILFKVFGSNDVAKMYFKGASDLIAADFVDVAPDQMLLYNHRVEPDNLENFVIAKAPNWSNGRLGPDNSWLPLYLRWNTYRYVSEGKRLICDPSREFLPFSRRFTEDDTARAAYLERRQRCAEVQQLIDEEEELTPEDEAEARAYAQHVRDMSLSGQLSLPDIIYPDEELPDPLQEPLDHVPSQNPDESEPEVDWGDDEPAHAEAEPEAEVEDVLSGGTSTRDDAAAQSPISEPLSPAIVRSPSQSPAPVSLFSRQQVRARLTRWAQSIQRQEGERVRLVSAIAAQAAERERQDETMVDIQEDINTIGTDVPQHPRHYVNLYPVFNLIRDLMTEPLNPPAYPSEITTFQHGDSRVFMTAEQLEKQTTQYSQQLKEFEQVDPQDQDEAQELFDRMVTEVLPGRREIDTQAQVNQWTGQIVYASLNLGDVKRRPFIPSVSYERWRSKGDRTMLIEFIRKCPAHVLCLAESAGITDEEVRTRLGGWRFLSSFDKNLAVGVRSDGTSAMSILYDTTDPSVQGGRDYVDDPSVPMAPETILWYMIVELNFGIIDASDHPDYVKGKGKGIRSSGKGVRTTGFVNHGTLDRIRVLTFVVHNKAAAQKPQATRLRLRQMFLDVARFQVDYLGGDANGSIYRYFKHQPVYSIGQSSFAVMLRTMVSAVNSVITDPKDKVHAGLITSNSQQVLDRIKAVYDSHDAQTAWQILEDEGVSCDCIVGVVLSWGHSEPLQKWRSEKGTSLLEITQDPILGFPEFDIRVAHYPFLLNNSHMWLNTSGNGDTSWHCPLFVRLRPIPDMNKRKRTQEKYEERRLRDQERYYNRGRGRGRSVASSLQEPASHGGTYSSSWRPQVPWTTTSSSDQAASSSTRERTTTSSSSSSWQGWSSWSEWQPR